MIPFSASYLSFFLFAIFSSSFNSPISFFRIAISPSEADEEEEEEESSDDEVEEEAEEEDTDEEEPSPLLSSFFCDPCDDMT